MDPLQACVEKSQLRFGNSLSLGYSPRYTLFHWGSKSLEECTIRLGKFFHWDNTNLSPPLLLPGSTSGSLDHNRHHHKIVVEDRHTLHTTRMPIVEYQMMSMRITVTNLSE